MRLSRYFFIQYLPSFFFGFILFTFVFLLDKLFDLLDLILNKGVAMFTIIRMLLLFIPTAFPLALPMSMLLGCMVTFGRLSEENEITAVRASGINLGRVLWFIPFFAFIVSCFLVPFNTVIAPEINKAFRDVYEKLVHADPLINISEKKFFSIKNIKIYTESINKQTNELNDVFVYVMPEVGKPTERIFARSGQIQSDSKNFNLILNVGQLERIDLLNPSHLTHVTFGQYRITVPVNLDKKLNTTIYRNLATKELKNLIKEQKEKGAKTSVIEAENSLRYALAYAPLCLVLMGIPLATLFKKGGRAFNTGLSLVVIFSYYLILIFGLTMAEKGYLPSNFSLWIANIICLTSGSVLFRKLIRK